MQLMGYSVSEGKRLGMGVDMTLGTGWCLGGPTVSDEDANASVVVRTFNLAEGEKLTEKFKPDWTWLCSDCGSGIGLFDRSLMSR